MEEKKGVNGLIIAHSPMSHTSGNGKTIAAMFGKWDRENLAQIYITSQEPDFSICRKYYNITDGEIIKSMCGKSGSAGHEVMERKKDLAAGAVKHKRLAKYKTSSVSMLIRNVIWNRKKWKSDVLLNWLNDIKPDFVFLAAGNLEAVYDIAVWITEKFQVPLIVHIGDDYFTKTEHSYLINELLRRRLARKLEGVIKKSEQIIAISDKMAQKFKGIYGGSYITCMNCVDLNKSYQTAPFFDENKMKYTLVYIGNLSVNRWQVLPVINKALEQMAVLDFQLDIYSNIRDKKVLEIINKLSRVNYKGVAYGQSLHKVQDEADILLMMESFDKKVKRILETAMSTKVPEYLYTGRPILAVGPLYSGSIEYLYDNALAEVVKEDSVEQIKSALYEMIKDKTKMRHRVNKGICLVKEKFSLEKNSNMVFDSISSICMKGSNKKQ